MRYALQLKETPEDKRNNYILYILIGLTITGAILRLYHLGYNSLWLDEAATYYHSINFSTIFDYNNSTDLFNPPVFFLFEALMIKLFGASEIGLRIIPAIFSIITIPAAYFMGREFYDKYTGIITAAVFTFSPFLIYYAQEARSYSLLMFLYVILMYIFLKALKSNNRDEWIIFGLISAIIINTHYYGAVFVAILSLYAIIYFRENIKAVLTGIGVGILFSLPMVILTAILYIYRTEWGAPTYGLVGEKLITGTLFELSGLTGYIPELIFLMLVASGIICLIYTDKDKALVLLWIICATFVFSLAFAPHMAVMPRYMIFLLIPFTLAIAYGSPYVMQYVSKNPIIVACIFIFIFVGIGFPFYQSYYTTYYKEDWRGVSSELSLAAPGSVIVPLPDYLNLPLSLYYNASEHGTTIKKITNISELKDYGKQESLHPTYYVITYDLIVHDPTMEMFNWFGKDLDLREKGKYGHVAIIKRG
jgi:mannosyltransferase